MMIPNYYPDDARVYLREELQSRKRRRPHYSLRAFARDLEMSPSFLCEFLAGRQGLSRERVIWISRRLELSTDQGDHFWDLVESRFGRSTQARKAANLRAMQRTKNVDSRLAVDRFQVIAEWYHFAILELLSLDGPQRQPKEMARVLGIPTPSVREALDRLQNLGLITRESETADWQVTGDVTMVGDEGPSRAIQLAHQEMLAMHSKAVETRPFDQRESLSVVFSMDKNQWPQFKRELREMLVSLTSRYAAETQRKDEVVCFSTQVLALTGGADGAAENSTSAAD